MLTEDSEYSMKSDSKRSWLAKVLRIEWAGQTLASIFWIASVLTAGISSAGDWLQLFAASSWLLANIAAITTAEECKELPS